MKRKIAVITGTRAEYGLLYWTMKGIQEADNLEFQLTGDLDKGPPLMRN